MRGVSADRTGLQSTPAHDCAGAPQVAVHEELIQRDATAHLPSDAHTVLAWPAMQARPSHHMCLERLHSTVWTCVLPSGACASARVAPHQKLIRLLQGQQLHPRVIVLCEKQQAGAVIQVPGAQQNKLDISSGRSRSELELCSYLPFQRRLLVAFVTANT